MYLYVNYVAYATTVLTGFFLRNWVSEKYCKPLETFWHDTSGIKFVSNYQKRCIVRGRNHLIGGLFCNSVIFFSRLVIELLVSETNQKFR